MNHIYYTMLLFFGLTSSLLGQSKIHPDLLKELQGPGIGNNKSAVVSTESEEDEAQRPPNLENFTRQQRHQYVIQELQGKASRSQEALLQKLEQAKQEGIVSSYEPLWITNSVLVKAEKAYFLELNNEPTVKKMFLDYRISAVPEDNYGGKNNKNTFPEISGGLELINADCLWSQGITGKNRLVAQIDSGVHGAHPALKDRWRGNRSSSAEAWYDPFTNSTIPTDYNAYGHGTLAMGAMVGGNNDIITGGAFEAEWIAAAVVERTGRNVTNNVSDILRAMQWIADPDGNPATITDVPDVVCNSWGFNTAFHEITNCDLDFWEAIDNLENAGIAVVFGAGNDGREGVETISTPANLPNAFAVGALDTSGNRRSLSSSQGPSPCNNGVVKPDIMARGSSVLSTSSNGSYSFSSGTSMAAPQVASAFALLRQIAPDASVYELKNAIIASATDLGTPGKDNEFGYGLIDMCKAAQLLKPCIEDVVVTANVLANQTFIEQASAKITANKTINAGAIVTYNAGEEVLLTDGFVASKDAVFYAHNAGCVETPNVAAKQFAGKAAKSIANVQLVTKSNTAYKIQTYPNPTTGQFTVLLPEASETVLQIYDLRGTLLQEEKGVTQSQKVLDLGTEPNGVYFVKVITAKQIYTKRIIKN